MEHQEKTQTSKATIVALPERGEYFSKFKNGWWRKEKQIEMEKTKTKTKCFNKRKRSYFSSLMSNSKEMLFENFKLNFDCLCLAAEKFHS